MLVSAVVVTYNRLELLKRCIEAIRNQTYKPNLIIVIDNESTDGTLEWLLTQNDLYVVNQINSGSSGGFCKGIKTAHELNSDWIWFMDDDGIPDKDCLKELISAVNKSSNRNVMLGSLVKDIDDDKLMAFDLPFGINQNNYIYWWFRLKKMNYTRNVVEYLSAYEKNEIGYAYLINPFNSIIISKETVELIKYPDFRYFIHGDEIDYLFRAFRANIKIYLVETSIFKCTYDDTLLSNWKKKYGIRNTIRNSFKYLSFNQIVYILCRTLYRIIKKEEYYLFKPFFQGIIGKYENVYHIKKIK